MEQITGRTIIKGENRSYTNLVFRRCETGTRIDAADLFVPEAQAQARQAADAEEMRWGPWVEWKGGRCPVEKTDEVTARLRCGTVHAALAVSFNWGHYGGDSGEITAYRVLKTAAESAEPAPLIYTADMFEAAGLSGIAAAQPKSDLPGIVTYYKWLAAQPAPVPPPAPTPREHPGLAVVAPMSGRVGGRWGV